MSEEKLCPECGAECNPTSRRCWLCEALLDQPAAGARGKRAPKNVVEQEHQRVLRFETTLSKLRAQCAKVKALPG